MPKLARWLIVSKKVDVFSKEVIDELQKMGVQFGGTHKLADQHIQVNHENKEKVEAFLIEHGYIVSEADSADSHANRES